MKNLLAVIGAALTLCGCATVANAQNAAVLPNARTQFINANGQPLVGGTVAFYIPSTLSAKTTWQDPGETTPNTNPITLDALGSALIWGSGTYREILKDSSGNTVWDGLTSGFSIGNATGILRGDGVGNISGVTLGSNLSLTGGPPGGTLAGTYTAPYAGAVQETITNSLKNVVNVQDFNAKCDGSTDDTTAIQAALNSGAGLVNFPTGTCNYTTLTISQSIRLEGANDAALDLTPGTVLQSTDTSASNKITIGNGASQVYGVNLEHMVLNAPSTTGGAVVFFNAAADSGLNDVQMTSIAAAAYGVKATQVNNLKLNDIRIISPITSGLYAYGDDSHRSDFITIHNFIVSGDATTSHTHIPNAIDIDGFVNTVDGSQILAVSCGRGWYFHNTTGTTQRAEYAFVDDTEVDFPYYEAVRIDYHDGVNFINSYFHGSITADNIYVSTGSPNTVTNISFIGGQSDSAWQRGMYLDGEYTRVDSMLIAANSQQSNGMWSGVELGPDSNNITISNSLIGNESGIITPTQSYGAQVDNGAINFNVTNNIMLGNVNGIIADLSDAENNSSGALYPNLGTMMPNATSTITATSGQTVNIDTGAGNLFVSNLNLTSSSTLSSFTINLPSRPGPQTPFRVFSNEAITTLTINPGSGDTITTSPTTLAANGSAAFIFNWVNRVWVRIQ